MQTSLADNLKGSLFMVIAMAGFTVNDLIVKKLGETLNLGQTVFIRGLFATLAIFLLTLMLKQWRTPSELFRGKIALRSIAEVIATFLFISAVFRMPIANVSAIFQALPLALTVAAALFMKEAVGIRRWSAITVGFIGVLIIIRPGLGNFSADAWLVIGAVAACVVRDMATRSINKAISSLMISLATAIAVTIAAGVLALFQDWKPVSPSQVFALALTSLFLIVGYYFIIASARIGDVGFVAPFRYSVLLFAIIGGILAFNEYPDRWTLIGAAIVTLSGIYMLYRERLVHRQKITPPPQRI